MIIQTTLIPILMLVHCLRCLGSRLAAHQASDAAASELVLFCWFITVTVFFWKIYFRYNCCCCACIISVIICYQSLAGFVYVLLTLQPRSCMRLQWMQLNTWFLKGGWYGWKPSLSSSFSIRAFWAQIYKFKHFEIILLFKFGKRFPVEQFEATVSQPTVPSPPLMIARWELAYNV